MFTNPRRLAGSCAKAEIVTASLANKVPNGDVTELTNLTVGVPSTYDFVNAIELVDS